MVKRNEFTVSYKMQSLAIGTLNQGRTWVKCSLHIFSVIPLF